MATKTSATQNALVAYVPALHQGYINLFKKYPGPLFILGKELVLEHPRMERDIRAVDPDEMAKAVASLGIVASVKVLTKENVASELASIENIIMPDEDVSKTIASAYFMGKNVTYETVFLRWDRQISAQEFVVSPDRVISTDDKDIQLIKEAQIEADKSSDWWRRIGAIVIKDGKIVLKSYNRHLPTAHNPNVLGDPRSNFDAGEHQDIYTSIHAEASVIAQAAREGISLKGTTMYMTTFPCSVCARSIAEAEISRIYYLKGYSRIDAEDILKGKGIEIVMVKMD